MIRRNLCWQGIGVSSGSVEGQAHVIRGALDFSGVGEGDVLVARHATPALLPGLVRARGAVCETGGMLNHLAILARELGKPCVTGVPGLVEAIPPGTLLRVDGTRGVVEILASEVAVRDVAPRPTIAQGQMIPVLQFGHFSTAFERGASLFSIEVAVRTAALVSLPTAFGGEPWPFTITDGQVLVAEAPLRDTVALLVDALEREAPGAAELQRQYDDRLAWHGWGALLHATPVSEFLSVAVQCYVDLNRLTWAASFTKEPLARRYRAFLDERLARSDADLRTRLYLDSLIAPGESYLLRSGLAAEEGPNTWGEILAGTLDPAGEPATAPAARELVRRASRHRVAAFAQLRDLLDDGDLERARTYVAALIDLLGLTERKNTDLHRRGLVLFHDAAHRAAIAEVCGLRETEGSIGSTAEECNAAVTRILAWLGREREPRQYHARRG